MEDFIEIAKELMNDAKDEYIAFQGAIDKVSKHIQTKYPEVIAEYMPTDCGIVFVGLENTEFEGFEFYSLTSCTLNQHLYETEQEAKRQIDLTLSRLVKERGITEELKATNPLMWVQEMSNAKQSAEEIMLNEMIYH